MSLEAAAVITEITTDTERHKPILTQIYILAHLLYFYLLVKILDVVVN